MAVIYCTCKQNNLFQPCPATTTIIRGQCYSTHSSLLRQSVVSLHYVKSSPYNIFAHTTNRTCPTSSKINIKPCGFYLKERGILVNVKYHHCLRLRRIISNKLSLSQTIYVSCLCSALPVVIHFCFAVDVCSCASLHFTLKGLAI